MRILSLAAALMAGAIFAQEQCIPPGGQSGQQGPASSSTAADSPTFKSDATNKVDSHDRPIGGIKMKLPLPIGSGGGQTPPPPPPPPVIPTPGGSDLPPTEIPPDPPIPEDPPTFYDELCCGKFAIDLDASGSMYGSRIASVRQESTTMIGKLREIDEFDFAAYGDQHGYPTYTRFMWGSLLPGTEGNKAAAISWVNGPTTNPGGGTPTYASLKTCINTWPADLDKMFLLTDGYPNTSGSASQILADFPAWWTRMDHCTLVCVCIGGVGSAQSFMMQLAALGGGVYIQR